MALNLRLPDHLDLKARKESQRLNISLNALICVALDQYLGNLEAVPPPHYPRTYTKAPTPPLVASRPPPAPKPLPVAPLPGAKLSKAQRREITTNARLARKA